MFTRVQNMVLTASALWQLSSAIPADPTITTAAVLPRQNDDNFIGWLSSNNTWKSETCDPNLRWFEDGPYAQCCPTTQASCPAAIACANGSQTYTFPDKSSKLTIACTENYGDPAFSICNTIYIYENSLDTNRKTNINCGISADNWSYTRDIPMSATAEQTSSPSISPSLIVPNPPDGEKSGSKVWIAGAVAGPVIGLALIGLGAWFFLRRKKKAAQAPQHGTASMAPTDPSRPPAGVGGYTDAKPQFAASQPVYYNQTGQPDSYAQQGYTQQGVYPPSPHMSPSPQYEFQSPYNTTDSSPPPGPYTHDTKHTNIGGTAELGGSTGGVAPEAPVAPASPHQSHTFTSQAAELSGGDVISNVEGPSRGDETAHNKT